MTEAASDSRVRLHPDGYVEIILVGVCEAATLKTLTVEVKELVSKHGPINGLIDARNGRAGRDARSLAQILQIGRVPKLKNIYLLYDPNTGSPDASPGPGIISSALTSTLGIGPIYLTDEAEARTKAAQL